jgi:hypothetical protein
LTDRLWTEAPGWSRAQKVTQTGLVDPTSLTLDNDGNLYLVVATGDRDSLRPSIVALDRSANRIWETEITTEANRIDNPSLLWDGDQLQAFWIADGSLFGAVLDKDGQIVGDLQLLSGPYRVDTYAVARRADRALSIWFAGPRHEPGLYTLPVGDPQGQAELVDDLGTRPAIKFDQEGTLHVSWVENPSGSSSARIIYGSYPLGEYSAGLAQEIRNEPLALSSVFAGPFIELDGKSIYVLWSEEVRTGPAAGQATTQYLTFPVDQLDQLVGPFQVTVPSDPGLEHAFVPEVGFEAGPRIMLEPGTYPAASGLNRINTNGNLANEAVFASESRIDYLFNKTAPQIGLSYFQDGFPSGYQLINFTSTGSTSPSIMSDEDGRLYLTWLERESDVFDVYLTSTAEDIKDNLNSLTLTDARQLLGETVFGLLIGALIGPIAMVIWLLIPLAVLLLTSPLRKENQSLRSPGTIISLGLTVLTYLLVKFFTLPGIREYVPFSAWLPLPSWIGLPLQILVPLAITIISLLAAWNFTYRRQNNAPMYFILIFAAADSVMTMAVYGVLIFNGL